MRKTIKVDEDVSEIIREMLDGNIVEVEDGGKSRRICNQLKELRERGYLYNGYDQKKKVNYLWFDEEVDEEMLRPKRKSVFGHIWDLIVPFK